MGEIGRERDGGRGEVIFEERGMAGAVRLEERDG